MGRYSRDPYMMPARYPGVCAETGKPFKRGDTIAYYPATRKAYCDSSKAADEVRALQFASAYGMPDADW